MKTNTKIPQHVKLKTVKKQYQSSVVLNAVINAFNVARRKGVDYTDL